LILILLTACVPKYSIELSELTVIPVGEEFMVTYTATNPTNYNLECELTIRLEELEDITDEFEILKNQTKTFSMIADLPAEVIKTSITTRCKPN